MPTESEIKTARYQRMEKDSDTFGRLIGVQRLKPSEQTRIAGMTAELTGADEVIGPNGQSIMVPHRMPLMVAAAVRLIDEQMIPFPRNRGELDAIFDRLDAEGLAAASRAMSRLTEDEMPPGVDKPLDATKNL